MRAYCVFVIGIVFARRVQLQHLLIEEAAHSLYPVLFVQNSFFCIFG